MNLFPGQDPYDRPCHDNRQNAKTKKQRKLVKMPGLQV